MLYPNCTRNHAITYTNRGFANPNPDAELVAAGVDALHLVKLGFKECFCYHHLLRP
jgi:hypothetical protein